MKSVGRMAIALLSVSALSLGVFSSSQAATHHSSMDSLVIHITKSSGTVWGKVTVDYKKGGKLHMLGACKKSKCTFHPPHMVKLTLTEKATDAMTWPFHSWKLANGHMKTTTSMGKTLKFEIQNGMAAVWANYVLKS